jgi:Ca2+-binding EF-hand superfamily protein
MGSVCGKLSKEDLEFLKLNTNCDEKTIKRMYKEFKKKSRKGQLSPALFYDMYVRLCPTDNAKDYCNHVFRTFDTDNNGYVSFKEFLLAINISSNGNPEQKLNWAFKLYDINGDGVINRCEMIIIVEAMFEMLDDGHVQRKSHAKEKAKEIFAKLDVNGDLRLSKEEFVSGCLNDQELSNLLTSHACVMQQRSLLETMDAKG